MLAVDGQVADFALSAEYSDGCLILGGSLEDVVVKRMASAVDSALEGSRVYGYHLDGSAGEVDVVGHAEVLAFIFVAGLGHECADGVPQLRVGDEPGAGRGAFACPGCLGDELHGYETLVAAESGLQRVHHHALGAGGRKQSVAADGEAVVAEQLPAQTGEGGQSGIGTHVSAVFAVGKENVLMPYGLQGSLVGMLGGDEVAVG